MRVKHLSWRFRYIEKAGEKERVEKEREEMEGGREGKGREANGGRMMVSRGHIRLRQEGRKAWHIKEQERILE